MSLVSVFVTLVEFVNPTWVKRQWRIYSDYDIYLDFDIFFRLWYLLNFHIFDVYMTVNQLPSLSVVFV